MKNTLATVLVSALILGAGFSSCDNTPGPGTAEVLVQDAAGLIQTQVRVRMYCTEAGCVVDREGRTNQLGIHKEVFELPVVLRVRAVRYDTTITTEGLPPNEIKKISVDSVCGEGFVQVENDEIAKETITILDCK